MTDSIRLQSEVVAVQTSLGMPMIPGDTRYSLTSVSCLYFDMVAFPFAIRHSPFAPHTGEAA